MAAQAESRPSNGRMAMVYGIVPTVAVLAAVISGRPRLAIPLMVIPPALAVLRRRDAVTLLTVYVLFLIAIPSRLVVAPLGASGTPANLVGLVALFWWGSSRLVPNLGVARGSQPVRIALGLFAASVTVGYALAYLRIYDDVQITAANRALVIVAAAGGIALISSDGIADRSRLDALLRRLVLAVTGMAVLGIIQFFSGADIASAFRIPGLTPNFVFGDVSSRSIFNRVQATAIHPIEFGVVLALVLPLAIHYALIAPKGKRAGPIAAAGLIAFALPTSVSRAAVLALVTVSLVLFAGWDWKRRRQAAVIAVVFLGMVRVAVPGLLGTIRSLFTNLFDDPSTTGRIDDYGYVGQFIEQSLGFGRGMYTFLPERFTTLDNQYLLTLVELGIFGLVTLLLIFVVGICLARGARRRSTDPETRQLGQALAGSLLAAMVTGATFDLLSFPMATGLVFLYLGCAGALWRLVRTGVGVQDAAERTESMSVQSRSSSTTDEAGIQIR